MTVTIRVAWMTAAVLLAALCAASIALVAALCLGSGPERSRGPEAAKDMDAAMSTAVDAEARRTGRGIGTIGSAPAGENAVQLAVDERLQEHRAVARERFEAKLVQIIEGRLERSLSDAERASLERSNRECFAALEELEARRGDTAGEVEARESLSRARKDRAETLVRILGSVDAAGRVIEQAMNALDEGPRSPGAL
jgi:hypothetical protein